jgi:hypothetical protein
MFFSKKGTKVNEEAQTPIGSPCTSHEDIAGLGKQQVVTGTPTLSPDNVSQAKMDVQKNDDLWRIGSYNSGSERSSASNEEPRSILSDSFDMSPPLMDNKYAVWESVSFACGGWLQFYMFGVAKTMQRRGVTNYVKHYVGCSAGALTAVGLALGGDFDLAIEFCKVECVPRCYRERWGLGLFSLADYCARCMNLTCNLQRWGELPPGRLHVAYTTLPFFKAVRQTQFESHDDLRQALMSSACAFPFAPLVHHRGHYCVDGGLSDFQPVINEVSVLD